MKLSKRTRYALRVMFRIALNPPEEPAQISEISKVERISEKFLSQIMIPLRSSGLVTSVRGAQGGYLLSRSADRITVYDVMEAMDGPMELLECVSDESCELKSSCTARRVWETLNERIIDTVSGIALSDMIEWHRKEKKTLNFSI